MHKHSAEQQRAHSSQLASACCTAAHMHLARSPAAAQHMHPPTLVRSPPVKGAVMLSACSASFRLALNSISKLRGGRQKRSGVK